MRNLICTEELLMRLKERFGVSMNSLNPKNFKVYSSTNWEKCPSMVVRRKIGNKRSSIYLVNEDKNMALAGVRYGKTVKLNTALYLDNRDGYENMVKF